MLLSTGSKEIQQLRWNSSLGRIFGAVSLNPLSSKCRSMRSSHGAIQPPPDSRNTQPRMTVDDTAPDCAECYEHHLHCMGDHMAGRSVAFETTEPRSGHRVG